jgi:hypothetical protein
MSSQLIITCDTESLVFPASFNSIQRNIFGPRASATGRGAGIEEIMNIADRVGAKVIFFYDVLTEYSFPGITQRVADSVLQRGHLLELHVHIEHLPESWWHKHGYKKPSWASNYFDSTTAELVYGDALRIFKRATGRAPRAFRAGAWRYNNQILSFLYNNGVGFSFNYYPATSIRASYPHGPDAGLLKPFRWSNGMIEIPVSTITIPNKFSVNQKYIGFENHILKTSDSYANFVNALNDQVPNLKTIVLVMHSWSLCAFENNLATEINPDIHDAFVEFMIGMRKDFQIDFSGSDIFDRLLADKYEMVVPIEFAGYGNSPLARYSA